MRTYYINNGKENGGPFTLDELKNQHLTKTTLVWYQGMDEWKYAQDIEEINFFLIPPPIKKTVVSPIIEEQKIKKSILGLKKSHFFLILLFIAILSTILVLNVIQNNKKNELDIKNKQTELSNEKITLEQNEFNEQKIQEEIRKRIEVENNNLRRRDSINGRISEIKTLLVDKKNQIGTLEKDLTDTEKFTFFRSENEKAEQIVIIQTKLTNLKSEIIRIENESDVLYLQLETIR